MSWLPISLSSCMNGQALSSLGETPAKEFRGGSHGREPGQAATRRIPALLLHSLLLLALPPMINQSGSELKCSRTLGVSWVQGGVAGPRGLLPTEVVFGWKV